MANYTRIEVANVMKQTGMVPLFYNADLEIGKQVIKATYDGGARLLEFTARGDFAHEVFGELPTNNYLLKAYQNLLTAYQQPTDSLPSTY